MQCTKDIGQWTKVALALAAPWTCASFLFWNVCFKSQFIWRVLCIRAWRISRGFSWEEKPNRVQRTRNMWAGPQSRNVSAGWWQEDFYYNRNVGPACMWLDVTGQLVAEQLMNEPVTVKHEWSSWCQWDKGGLTGEVRLSCFMSLDLFPVSTPSSCELYTWLCWEAIMALRRAAPESFLHAESCQFCHTLTWMYPHNPPTPHPTVFA